MFKFLKEKISTWAKKIAGDKKDEKENIKKISKPVQKAKKEGKIKVPASQDENIDSQKEELELQEEFEEKPGFFSKLKSKISKTTISEEDFSLYAEELEMLLIENNVAYEVAERIIKVLKARIIGKEILKKEVEQEIKETLRSIIEEVLVEPFDIISRIVDKGIKKEKEPFIIIFAGINGTGKTTTIAKIAHHLKKKNLSSIIAAGDTFRAASIEQLKKHGSALGVKVISQEYGADPASVGFDAISYAKKNHMDCVLIDTAGRMHTAKNLMREIEKITKVCKPDLKIFVGESITGNDSIEQIRAFDSAIGIDAIILSKADIDEKGGTALSLGFIAKKPILFLGTGQGYDDLEIFNKKKFLERLGL